MTALAKKVFELFGKPERSTKTETRGETLRTREASQTQKDGAPSATIDGELVDATPTADQLLIFPEWQGLLVKSVVLGMSVWVVRSHVDGIALAKDTGFPSLLLDDVLKLKGRTADEARAALLPALITATVQ